MAASPRRRAEKIEKILELLPPSVAELLRQSTEHPLDALDRLEDGILVKILRRERPVVIATLLGYLDARRCAVLIKLLPKKLLPELIEEMARERLIEAATLRDLNDFLSSAAEDQFSARGKSLGGVTAVAKILSSLGRDQSDKALKSFSARDPHLAAQLRSQLFQFEDLVLLESSSLRALFSAVPWDHWCIALRVSSVPLNRELKLALSEKQWSLLQTEIEEGRPQKSSKIKEIQTEIARKAFEMQQSGQLLLRSEVA